MENNVGYLFCFNRWNHNRENLNHESIPLLRNRSYFNRNHLKYYFLFIFTYKHIQIRSVAQLCPTLCDPHESQHARPPCPSPTPRVHWDSRPLSQWCHPAISSSVVPFCAKIPNNTQGKNHNVWHPIKDYQACQKARKFDLSWGEYEPFGINPE